MTTSTGIKDYVQKCQNCGRVNEDDILVVSANGKAVCSDCSSSSGRKIIRADCEDGVCTCVDREPEDGRLEDASVEE
jgi:hypothetical protein